MTDPQNCPEGIHGHLEIDPEALADGRAIDLGNGAFAFPGDPAEVDEGPQDWSGWQKIGATEDGIPLGLRPRGSVTGEGD